MALEPAALTRLARLSRELDVDLGALDARACEAGELTARSELSRAELVLLAVNLHGYYTALETLFERVANLFDQSVPSGPSWHSELIEQMRTEVPGLRPPLVPDDAAAALHALRKFRHFFRNAYVLELDPARVHAHAARLVVTHASLRPQLTAFRGHLDQVVAALGR